VPLGFALAAAYLWFARPEWTWIAAGSGFVLAGLAVRAAASGYIKKNRELTTTGPYAYSRNPLYLGSILIALGFVVAARNAWIAAGAALMFFAIYMPVVIAEEKHLRSIFADYDQYAASVPRFFPRVTGYKGGQPGGGYSRELYMKHREYQAALGSALMMAALIAKMLLMRH
jgi:protein-S-isoprenylcysteine O-methyltransferase Ste14